MNKTKKDNEKQVLYICIMNKDECRIKFVDPR